MISRVIFLFLFLVSGLCAGCGVDGADPYALWQHRSHPGRLFSFYHPSPPWAIAPGSTPEHPALQIDPILPIPDSGLPAEFFMEAWFVAGESATELADERMAFLRDSKCTVSAISQRMNGFEQQGLAVEADDCGQWFREVIFDSTGGACIFSVRGKEYSAMADVNLLLDGFRPASPVGSQ